MLRTTSLFTVPIGPGNPGGGRDQYNSCFLGGVYGLFMSPGKEVVPRASNLADSGRREGDSPKLENERNCLLGATFRTAFIHHNKCGVLAPGVYS